MDVTLYTVPLYKTSAYNYVVSDDALTNGSALNWARTTDQISLYWFPAFNELVVSNWTIVDVNMTGNAFTYDHTTSTYANLNAITAIVREIAGGLMTTACALASSTGNENYFSHKDFGIGNIFFRIFYSSRARILPRIGIAGKSS